MSEKNDDSKKNPVNPELDDLLDSALQDMTKKDSQGDTTSAEVPQNLWSEEFIKEAQHSAQFESSMASILGSLRGVPVNNTTVGSGQCTSTVPMATTPKPKENKAAPAPGICKILRRHSARYAKPVPMATTPKPTENKAAPAPGSSRILRRHSARVPKPESTPVPVLGPCTSTVSMATTPKPKDNKTVPGPAKIVRRHSDRRPKPAHSGVPVPEKMKKLSGKKLKDFFNI